MLYRIGQHSLDVSRYELCRDGRPWPLEPRVLKLIVHLIESRHRVVTRDEIHRHLWGNRVVTENALNVCIKAAREALGDSGKKQTVIRTLPRVGYRFIADVDVRTSMGTVPFTPEEIDIDQIDKKLLAKPSVIVLPFTTIGDPGDYASFAHGLTHDVTTRIARTRTLFVIARGTAFQFDGELRDVKELGETLGVRYVVQGSVQLTGQRMRVTATLAEARTREEIWSESYERRLDDFVMVQEELAELIVGSLQSAAEHTDRLRSLLKPSNDLDAWSAYHRGCWHMYRFRAEDVRHAERYFRQSIALDPTVPRPYAGLSFINFERAFIHIDPNPKTAIQRAFDYAMQALTIDPLDPMSHWALSRVHLIRGELELSRLSVETAISLNPSYAIAHYSLGWVGMQLGEYDLCRNRIDMALKLSPVDPLKFGMLAVSAQNSALSGREAEAIAFARQAVAQPNAHHGVLASAAVALALCGKTGEGGEYLRRVRAFDPTYSCAKFLSVQKFKRPSDIDRIGRAFVGLDAYLCRSGSTR